MLRQVDEDFFPHRAALAVVEEVDLVEHHGAQVVQGLASEQHVAEDLGGHHQAGGVPPDDQVSGDQPDLVGAVQPHVVPELLVGEGLDGRGVDHLLTIGEGLLHDPVGDDGLPRAGRRTDEGRLACVEGRDGGGLERVERESAVLHACGYPCRRDRTKGDNGTPDPGAGRGGPRQLV